MPVQDTRLPDTLRAECSDLPRLRGIDPAVRQISRIVKTDEPWRAWLWSRSTFATSGVPLCRVATYAVRLMSHGASLSRSAPTQLIMLWPEQALTAGRVFFSLSLQR